MDPLLLWLVSGLSALLLAVGGALVTRAALVGRMLRQRARAAELRAAFADLESRHRTLVAAHEQARDDLRQAREREAALRGGSGNRDASSGRDGPDAGFEEATSLPEPVDFFRHVQAVDAAPGLDRVAQDEYEIQDAAPQGFLEGADAGSDEAPAPQDSTRQFNLHSPEAVVHFLQRIDELTDENRELREAMEQRDEVIRGQRAQGGEQVQRFAALDATVDKLRQELKRRSQRVAQLEVRLREALEREAAASKEGAPSMVKKLSSDGAHAPSFGQTSLDAPTLQVPRVHERDLASDKK